MSKTIAELHDVIHDQDKTINMQNELIHKKDMRISDLSGTIDTFKLSDT